MEGAASQNDKDLRDPPMRGDTRHAEPSAGENGAQHMPDYMLDEAARELPLWKQPQLRTSALSCLVLTIGFVLIWVTTEWTREAWSVAHTAAVDQLGRNSSNSARAATTAPAATTSATLGPRSMARSLAPNARAPGLKAVGFPGAEDGWESCVP